MRLQTLEARAFLVLVVIVTAAFLWMVRAFLLPVFWAVVFAVLFRPVYLRIRERTRGRDAAAAGVTTVLVVFSVLLPFALLVAALAQQAFRLYERIASGEVDLYAPIAFVERSLPRATELLERYGVELADLRAGVENIAITSSQLVAAQAITLGQNALLWLVFFGLFLYFLFYFLRDGDRIMEGLVRALPLGDDRERELFRKFAEVSRATVYGTLMVAAVQGGLGGILFWIVGIEAPVFWGVVMGILSILPAVGAFLVWGPAAVILFLGGMIWQPIVLVIGGAVVVGLADNILRPILVGRQAKMPDYLVLLATLGGLAVFGLSGFVAGPMIAALFLVVWQMFADEYAPLIEGQPAVAVAGPAPPESADPADVEVFPTEPDSPGG
jgi:predicted PurR-regulated permease PerM